MDDKIKNVLNSSFAQQFRDIRFIGFAAFGVIVLLVSWSGVKVIETNFELQKQLSKMRQENQVAELANNNLKLQNQYYSTDQYLEIQARRQFGKGLPGEKLVLVPKSVALGHTVDLSQESVKPTKKTASRKAFYQRNFEAWRKFMLRDGLQE